MKKVLFSLTALVLSVAAIAQVKSDDIAKIKVETVDLGKIPQGIPAVSTFIVTNIGKTDLIIESANPTCGCTVGDYTKAPIPPGKTGTITATFNAAGLGPINKHMNVKFAGAEDTKSIGFTGEVLSADDYAKLKAGIPATPATTAVAATAPTKAITAPMAAVKAPKAKGKKSKKSCVNC
jgi:Protein of unknown function (DUF1573)